MLTANLLRTAAGVLASGLALALPCAANGRDLVVQSFDGTPIVAHFFGAAGLAPGQRAPTVLLAHGWSRAGTTDPEEGSAVLAMTGPAALRHAGYNILTWDPRGFGGSGDRVRFDAPGFEARDVQALIDEVSRQPEAQLDAPGDPRVGMAGASYGAGIQLVAAAIDHRIDAIAPSTAWHSLVTSFYKDDTLKTGWMLPICASGAFGALVPGLASPAGPQFGGLDPYVYELCTAAFTTGVLSDGTVAWLASRGPGDEYVGRVRAPTLLLASTADTLITLDEAIANHRILTADRVPTKMMWFCQGHASCPTSDGPPGYVQRALLGWFARWLKDDPNVDLGSPFEWLDQAGTWRAGSGYPLRAAADLVASGGGTLVLTPAASALSGKAYAATPSRQAVSVDIPAPADDADIVGAPQLELTYSGRANDPAATVFAQVVDVPRGIVAGNQVTPIPLTLDGRERTVSRPLEALAQHATRDSRYRLQLIAGTQLYDAQRSLGDVRFSRISIALPLVRDARPRAIKRSRLRRARARRVAPPRGRRSRAH